jgi:CheY-like chemotaxis protein
MSIYVSSYNSLFPSEIKEKYRILLVEDDPIIRRVGTLSLEKIGYPFDVAPDANVALNLFQSQTYHIVLLDIGLPGLDGITACERMREIEKRLNRVTYIAAMTGFMEGSSAYEDAKKSECFDDYLEKPVCYYPENMVHTLDNYVYYHVCKRGARVVNPNQKS